MMRCTGAFLSRLSEAPHPNFIVALSNIWADGGNRPAYHPQQKV